MGRRSWPSTGPRCPSTTRRRTKWPSTGAGLLWTRRASSFDRASCRSCPRRRARSSRGSMTDTRTPRTSGSPSPRMPPRRLGSIDRRRPGSAAESSFATTTSATSRLVTTLGIGTAGTTTATTSPKATTSFGSGPTTGSWHPRLSKGTNVAIARTYRATKTKSKTANAYHHVGPVTPLVLGGGCIVFRTAESRLQILCQGGRVSVYWRWGLASSRTHRARQLRARQPRRLSPLDPKSRAYEARILLHDERGPRRSVGELPSRHREDHLQLSEGVLAPLLPNPHRPEPQSRGP